MYIFFFTSHLSAPAQSHTHLVYQCLLNSLYLSLVSAPRHICFSSASASVDVCVGFLPLIPLTLLLLLNFGAPSISAVAWLSFSSSASALVDRT